ncbi:hypothetical protein N7471_013752 [Penicillium samsonianum]|uniref:uncharacterized protein n=1 Tax=Penicillium samsonianum TaxID=1882272 RepID=UPI002549055C|nr:uncharacterized protein N7471_013752 [Penicillium samsonianum]KAJ6118285.1 hypothetical protein N7471_013752 [Penicillium samsonianum]
MGSGLGYAGIKIESRYLIPESGFPFQNLSRAQYPQAGRLVPGAADMAANVDLDNSHLLPRNVCQHWQRAM